METRKKECLKLVLPGLFLFVILAIMTNFTGASNYRILEQSAINTASAALNNKGYNYINLGKDGINLMVYGIVPSYDDKENACKIAYDALKNQKMIGLPGIFYKINCKIAISDKKQ